MILKCPVCQQKLYLKNNLYAFCNQGHHYDYNKYHILNLALSQKRRLQGDDDVMSIARHNFLIADYYLPLIEQVAKVLKNYSIKNIVDCGSGQGYYLDYLSKNLNVDSCQCYALDLSQKLLRLGQKYYKQYNWIVANIKKTPIIDNSASLVLNAFVPLFLDEMVRILEVGGYLVVIDVGYHHLSKMKEVLYPQVIYNQVSEIVHPNLKMLNCLDVEFNIDVIQAQLQNLLMMTPYYYRTEKKAIDKLKTYNSLEIDCHFVVRVFQKII